MAHFKQDDGSVLSSDAAAGLAATAAGIDRREFLGVALGASFALAVQPVAAQSVINTDSIGLTAGTVIVHIDGQDVPVYRAQPEGKSGLPIVLVVSEIFGVHAHIADVARRFAKLGYLALSPDLFVRQGDAGSIASIPQLMKDIIAQTPDRQVLQDLDACVAWAGANGGNVKKMGVTGFCYGGRITWLYAAHNPELKAGVAWYGRLVAQPTLLQPSNPVDIAASLTVPVLGLYGGKDDGILQVSIEHMKAALAKGDSQSQFQVYPDAGHAFNADYRPSYVAADARDGFARCLAWFKAHGVA